MEIGVVERNPESNGRDESAPDKERSKAELDKEAAERLEEIHQHLRDRYASREVVARTETPAGQQLDWVPIESQSSDGKIADPPDEDRPAAPRGGEYHIEPPRFELQHEDAKMGPPGTVPVVRKPIERIRPVGDLQDWLAKGSRAKRLTPPDARRGVEPPGDSVAHKYAHAYQPVTCYGTEGNINIWKPYVEWSDEFSLGQLWLVRGSDIQRQTLEVGHQLYPDLYGDWEPHLFIFYTTNNSTQSGDYLGGYNQDVDGWVQVSQSIFPEALPGSLSQLGGQQFEMALKVQLYEDAEGRGNWWIRVNGEWMGYYPASLYSPFTGLRSEASIVDWGGEIVDEPAHPETTETDMGSGHFPHEGWQHCAYMNNLQYQSGPDGLMTRFQGVPSTTHPNCYGLTADFGHTGTWGSHFWWGGSGRNPACP